MPVTRRHEAGGKVQLPFEPDPKLQNLFDRGVCDFEAPVGAIRYLES